MLLNEFDEINGSFVSSTSGTIIRRRNIFAQYAKSFRILLARWIPICSQHQADEEISELTDLILPSDEEWRQKVYYTLVELQREWDAEIASKRSSGSSSEMESPKGKETKVWEWVPGTGGYPLKAKVSQRDESMSSLTAIQEISGSMTEACIEPGWRINDILLAARVLQKSSLPLNYADEFEMRRVFGLVYDVLRYKNILNQALEDVRFWYQNPSMKSHERIVWLLLYDMQGRKFARFGDLPEIEERDRIFRTAGLKEIEDKLLEMKTHLAASISRLRIGGSALNLAKLLPLHLQMMEGVSWGSEGSIASGWVNTMKISNKEEFSREMAKLGFHLCEDCNMEELEENYYTFDPLCPKIVNLHDKAREKLAVSSLVREHRFVFLERSLCLGAAALAQAIRVNRLCGPVVLTHCLAPRHTGYLAGLLADIEDAGRLLAFGTGDRRFEYETYLKNLGVSLQQCRIYSEKYTSAPASAELDRATVVLAMPPCSYTGLRDVVDLAVARDGDIELLEKLTNGNNNLTYDIEEAKGPRALLTDQFSTLKHALTRPNVQYLIYEAHTILASETSHMVRQVVDYANRLAMEKHLRNQLPKKKSTGKDAVGKSSKSGKLGKIHQLKSQDEDDDVLVTDSISVTVPDSDLFEAGTIDEIYGENSSCMMDSGCCLAVIKRKEMMQFDSLFMIKVAESKGLFGDLSEEAPKRVPVIEPAKSSSQSIRKEHKRPKIEIERLMAPTHSSLLRISRENQVCPRHLREENRKERLSIIRVREARKRDIRRWWSEAASAQSLRNSSGTGSVDDFKLTRTDPLTLRLLYPCHIERLQLPIDYKYFWESRKKNVQNILKKSSKDSSEPKELPKRVIRPNKVDLNRQVSSKFSKSILKHTERKSNQDAIKLNRSSTGETFSDISSSFDLNVPGSRQRARPVESSTAIRSTELTRAVQRIPLERLLHSNEINENIDKKRNMKRVENLSQAMKTSRPAERSDRSSNDLSTKQSMETIYNPSVLSSSYDSQDSATEDVEDLVDT